MYCEAWEGLVDRPVEGDAGAGVPAGGEGEGVGCGWEEVGVCVHEIAVEDDEVGGEGFAGFEEDAGGAVLW